MDNENQEFQIPNEQAPSTNIELPKNPNVWLFVMITIGISSIFSILMVLQNQRIEDFKKSAENWESRYNKQVKKTDSVISKSSGDDVAIQKVYKMKQALYKIDSITRSNPNEKITKRKLNDEIKSAIVEE